MSNEKDNTADSLLKGLGVYLGVIPKEEVETKTDEVKEPVKLEAETKEEEAKVEFASELAEGDYTLDNGTKFRIDAEGNVVGVEAPSEEEAESEEAAKDAEDMEAKENLEESKLSAATKEIEELKEKATELSATKPISNAPKKKEQVKLNQFSKRRTRSTQDRVMERISKIK